MFRLTPEQRETLLHAWARATDRTRVERLFLPAAEVVLDFYFHIEVALMTRPSEVRQTIELLRDKVRAARVALRAVATNAGATEVLEFHARDLPRQELPLPVEILLDYDPDSAAYPARALEATASTPMRTRSSASPRRHWPRCRARKANPTCGSATLFEASLTPGGRR